MSRALHAESGLKTETEVKEQNDRSGVGDGETARSYIYASPRGFGRQRALAVYGLRAYIYRIRAYMCVYIYI